MQRSTNNSDEDTDLGTEAEDKFTKTRHHHRDLRMFTQRGFTQKVELHLNVSQPEQDDAVEKAAKGCFKCCFSLGSKAAK